MLKTKWVFVLKIFMEQLQIVSESPLSYCKETLRIGDATRAQNFQFRYLQNGCRTFVADAFSQFYGALSIPCENMFSALFSRRFGLFHDQMGLGNYKNSYRELRCWAFRFSHLVNKC